MTLQNKLNQYIERYCLSGAEAARRIGVHPTKVSDIKNHNRYGNITAEKIYKALGEDFREYVIYQTCPYCGEEYAPRDNTNKNCGNNPCAIAHRNAVEKEYRRKVDAGEHVKAIGKSKKKKYLVVEDVKPPVSIAEYNSVARKEHGSYGQRGVVERLAQSGTMRESMGIR